MMLILIGAPVALCILCFILWVVSGIGALLWFSGIALGVLLGVLLALWAL